MRVYERKTNRGSTPPDEILKAVKLVVNEGKLCRSVAMDMKLCHVSLSRYCKQYKKLKEKANHTTENETFHIGFTKPRQIMPEELENLLAEYILRASKLYYGLSPKEVRKLAYELTIKNKLKIPQSWSEKSLAGADWFSSFLKRHSFLSIRTPEVTSLSRATSFNRTNVKSFFDNLAEVMSRHNFQCQDIYNIDETGITTVQKPNKIIAEKGIKQVSAMTSGERGQLVTLAVGVSASGNSVPPIFIFPRVNFRDHFIRDGPPGCIGAANPSGWMNESTFLIFMQHFVHNVKCSLTKPVLVLLDNHESHLSIDVIDFYKENGVVLLSFPPHCSHKLQPLNRSVFGPLKKFVNTACDSWMKNNPAKTMSIYDIPAIVRDALPHALTPSNIQAGFKVAGIFPFNRDVFSSEEFEPGSVTDQPIPAEQVPQSPQTSLPATVNSSTPSPVAQDGPSTSAGIVTPEQLRPFGHAERRKSTNRGKKRKTAILTDTPVKNALLNEKTKKKATKKAVPVSTAISKKRGHQPARKNTNASNDDTSCIVCGELFSGSRRGEDWIQCTRCSKWAHEECTDQDPCYICHLCDSDSD